MKLKGMCKWLMFSFLLGIMFSFSSPFTFFCVLVYSRYALRVVTMGGDETSEH